MNLEPIHLYRALVDLGRSLAECEDPDEVLARLFRILRTVVEFDHLVLLLNEGNPESLRAQVMDDGQRRDTDFPKFAINETPIGWVWDKQETVIIPRTEAETRWPAFTDRLVSSGLRSLIALPLLAGDRKVGALAISRRIEYEPVESELAFLQRVAAELAVTMNVYLTRKELALERDRLRVLNGITNALISKLSPDELFAAISNQLQKIIPHSSASIALWDQQANEMELYSLQVPEGETEPELPRRGPLGPPVERVISGRQALVFDSVELAGLRPEIAKIVADRGVKSLCVLPLITPNAVIGTLNLTGNQPDAFSNEDVQFLSQVAGQIAVAIENSLVYKEVTQLKERLATEKLYLEEEIRLDKNLTDMVGQSPALQAVINAIQIVAPTDATVLILGETGTGKELVARALHDLSGRKQQTFVKLSCAAIPGALLESELFGHERGAFTGATNSKIGRFELAHRGTLFLDEVGEIPLELQSKLLRAIQEQEFERLGSNRTIRVDVRIVAATNRDLKKMVQENQFRSDLYYRLSVFPIRVPPLRERREDIPLLVRHFVQRFAKRLGRSIEVIPSGVIECLRQYNWPGNIRELQNLIERSVILSTAQALQVPLAEIQGEPEGQAVALPSADSAERDRIIRALKETHGIVGGPRGAAARLGLKRTTLQSRIKKLNINREYR
ncbi:MAG: sigma 54-interacting transcriptional regulator [Acidobacteriota bacterium]